MLPSLSYYTPFIIRYVFDFLLYYQYYGLLAVEPPKPEEADRKDELKVSYMKRSQLIFTIATTIAGTMLLGNFASRLHEWFPLVFSMPSAYPYVDSFIMVMSIITTFYMIQKKIECWVIWIIVDIVATFLYYIRHKILQFEYRILWYCSLWFVSLDKRIQILYQADPMKRGLVIGKFMPLHKGHIALIEFAVSQCDELIVSMSFADTDPIDPQLRFNWIKEQFNSNPAILPRMIKDDFDNEQLPLAERTAVWAEKMREVYPRIDTLISSELYGEPFAANLAVEHIMFDKERISVPISATLYSKPLTNWHIFRTYNHIL